jgi:hypothetical protein
MQWWKTTTLAHETQWIGSGAIQPSGRNGKQIARRRRGLVLSRLTQIKLLVLNRHKLSGTSRGAS